MVLQQGSSEQLLWAAFSHFKGISLLEKHRLLGHFESLQAIYAARHIEIETLLQRQIAANLQHDLTPDQRILQWLEQPLNHLITYDSDEYPPQLRQLSDPPLVLYASGDPTVLQAPQIAMVGSRRHTPTGQKIAKQFANAFSVAGLTVTSGLAQGIDTAAHSGCLQAGGLTVAVKGNGLDCVYPSVNTGLAADISRQGCLLSEFSLGSPPHKAHFPRRNRLIAALSYGVVVVEAALRSGSLITARLAVEQGKDVFAVPGSVLSPQSKGCHWLIQQGAALVQSPQDVLSELQLPLMQHVQTVVRQSVGCNDRDKDSEMLLKWIGYDPTSQDEIIRRSGLSSGQVLSILSELELKGVVTRCGNGQYTRSGEFVG